MCIQIQSTLAEIRAWEYSRCPRQPGLCQGARGGEAGKFWFMQLSFSQIGLSEINKYKAKPFKCALSPPLCHWQHWANCKIYLLKPSQAAVHTFKCSKYCNSASNSFLLLPTHRLLSIQGDRANGMYFVESGTLVVLKKMGGDAGDEKAVNEVDVDFQKLSSFYNSQMLRWNKGSTLASLHLWTMRPGDQNLFLCKTWVFWLRAATVAAKDNVRVACKFNFSCLVSGHPICIYNLFVILIS